MRKLCQPAATQNGLVAAGLAVQAGIAALGVGVAQGAADSKGVAQGMDVQAGWVAGLGTALSEWAGLVAADSKGFDRLEFVQLGVAQMVPLLAGSGAEIAVVIVLVDLAPASFDLPAHLEICDINSKYFEHITFT